MDRVQRPGSLTRAARRAKAGVCVLRIVRPLATEPGRPLEALALVRELDLGEPEIALAEMIQLEAADLPPHLAQAAGAHPEQRLGILVGDGVVELRARHQAFAFDGELGVPRALGPRHEPDPHRRVDAQVSLLQLVPLRQILGQPLRPHQELPLDLCAHGFFLQMVPSSDRTPSTPSTPSFWESNKKLSACSACSAFDPNHECFSSHSFASAISSGMTMWPMSYSCHSTSMPSLVRSPRSFRTTSIGMSGSCSPWAAKTGKPRSLSGAVWSRSSSARATPDSESTPAASSGRRSATPRAIPAPWLKPRRNGRGEPAAISATAAAAPWTAARASSRSNEICPRGSCVRANQARIGPPRAIGPCSETTRSRGSSSPAMGTRSCSSAP